MLKVTFRCRHAEWIKSMHICQSGYIEPPCRHFSYEEHRSCSLSSHRPCQDGISVQSDHRLLCGHCSLLALAKQEGRLIICSLIHPRTFDRPSFILGSLSRYVRTLGGGSTRHCRTRSSPIRRASSGTYSAGNGGYSRYDTHLIRILMCIHHKKKTPRVCWLHYLDSSWSPYKQDAVFTTSSACLEHRSRLLDSKDVPS